MKKSFIAMLPLIFSSGMAWAQTGGTSGASTQPTVSKESREKMAVHHEKMAACLRSNRSMEECHNEMRAACEQNHEACPMMGMEHKGMKKHKMAPPAAGSPK